MHLDEKDNELMNKYLEINELYNKGEDIDIDVLDFFAETRATLEEKGLGQLHEEYTNKAWSYILRNKDMNLYLMGLLAQFVGDYIEIVK